MRTTSGDICTVVEVEMCSSLEVVPGDSEVRAVVGVILLLVEVTISTVLEGTDEKQSLSCVSLSTKWQRFWGMQYMELSIGLLTSAHLKFHSRSRN